MVLNNLYVCVFEITV